MQSEIILFDGDSEEFVPGSPLPDFASPLPPPAHFSQLMAEANQINTTQPFLPPMTPQQNPAESVAYHETEKTRDRTGVTSRFKPSKTAQQFMGVRVPHSTRAASEISFRLFADFVLNLLKQPTKDNQYCVFSRIAFNESIHVPGDGLIEQSAVRAILQNRSAILGLDSECNERLCHFLVEFCTSYVSKKRRKKWSLPPCSLTYVEYSVGSIN